MEYFDNLDDLLKAIRSEETNNSAIFLLERQLPMLEEILAKVTSEGYGLPGDEPKVASFLKFVSIFSIVQEELIDDARKKENSRLKTCKDYLRLVAQYFWSDKLYQETSLRTKVLTRIGRDRPELLELVQKKLWKLTDKQIDAKECLSHALEKLVISICEGRYRGGNVKAYIAETGYNHWRDQVKRAKRTAPESTDKDHDTPQRKIILDEVYEQLYIAFLKLSDSCQRTMLAFFNGEGKSREEMAKEAGFKSQFSYNNALKNCRPALISYLKREYPKL